MKTEMIQFVKFHMYTFCKVANTEMAFFLRPNRFNISGVMTSAVALSLF